MLLLLTLWPKFRRKHSSKLPDHPVNMPDPIRKLLGYGQLWPLRPACGQNRAGSYNYASSDFPHPIQFRFSKEGMDHLLCNTDSDLIWMACLGFGQTRLVWKQAGEQESSGSFCDRTQQALYQFPTFRLCVDCSFKDVPDHIVQNQRGSDLVSSG